MITLQSPAKINWYLRVLDRRADGYHNIETLFNEISLSDELRFSALEDVRCEITGFPADLPAERNLIYRAWELMRICFGDDVRGIAVAATKNIPAGGGLGGGSSNAATTLRALSQLYKLQPHADTLRAIALELGSDVPFFLRGGAAIGRGRGELLEQVSAIPSYHLVLVFPDSQVSTADAYRRIATMKREAPRFTLNQLIAELATGEAERVAGAISNDFELVVEECDWYVSAIRQMTAAGCLRAFLTGSGSTIVGLCSNAASAKLVVRSLQGLLPYQALYVSSKAC